MLFISVAKTEMGLKCRCLLQKLLRGLVKQQAGFSLLLIAFSQSVEFSFFSPVSTGSMKTAV